MKQLSLAAFEKQMQGSTLTSANVLIAYDLIMHKLPIKQAATKYGLSPQRISVIRQTAERHLDPGDVMNIRILKFISDPIFPQAMQKRMTVFFKSLGFLK